MTSVKQFLFFFLACFTGVCLQAASPERKTMQIGGYEREYLCYVPDQAAFGSASQLNGIIVYLHGLNSKMSDCFDERHLERIADSLHYIILSPQALPEQDQKVISTAELAGMILPSLKFSLNAVWSCGLKVKAEIEILAGLQVRLLEEELNKNVDDVGFISSMIDFTKAAYPLAHEAIFLIGTSMGGYMSYQYALISGKKLSGIIPIVGSMGLNIRATDAQIKLPVCDFHSLTDEVVPYYGTVRQSGYTVSLAWNKEDVIDFWVNKNGITADPVIEDVHYYPSTNGITVQKITYPDPVNEVIHYRLNGSGHSYFFEKANGDCMDHVEECMKFISRHAPGMLGDVEQVSSESGTLYPNPVDNILRFEKPEAGTVDIFDPAGKLMYSDSFRSGQLNVSFLKRGLYFVRVQGEAQRYVTKLIKQ